MKLTVFIFMVVATASASGSCLRGSDDSMSVRCKRAVPLIETAPDPSRIIYKLYTPKFSSEGRIITADNASLLTEGGFEPSLKTIVIIHGWNSNQQPVFSGFRLKNVIFNQSQDTDVYFNVILVDWSPIDDIRYPSAAKTVPIVGAQNARVLKLIINTFGYGADKFHIVGHSLGAHIAGVTTRSLDSKEPVITGLDPAGPLFGSDNPDRLTSKDSNNVVAIYTCAGFLSLGDSVGHTNIYPHGGRWVQPGCAPDLAGICSHCRAYLIQAESILNNGLVGQQCSSFGDFQKGQCDEEPLQTIDTLFPTQTPRGDFYFWSNPTSPYNPASSYGVNLEWETSASLFFC